MRETLESHVNEIIDSKIIQVKEMSIEEAARKIDDYLSRNPGAHYVSELAEKLGIELPVAFGAAKKLRQAGAVRVKK